jgi:hypothetical protein
MAGRGGAAVASGGPRASGGGLMAAERWRQGACGGSAATRGGYISAVRENSGEENGACESEIGSNLFLNDFGG